MTTAYMLAGGGAHELLTYGADIAFTFPFTLLRSQNNKLLHIMMSSSSMWMPLHTNCHTVVRLHIVV